MLLSDLFDHIELGSQYLGQVSARVTGNRKPEQDSGPSTAKVAITTAPPGRRADPESAEVVLAVVLVDEEVEHCPVMPKVIPSLGSPRQEILMKQRHGGVNT